MQIQLSDDVHLDSRRAIWLPRQGTLVLSDFFLGLGAARRKRPDAMPLSGQQDVWERLFTLLDDLQPKRVALLGDVKPNQGSLEGEEAEELRTTFRKIAKQGREVIQVVGHPERAWGPAMEGTGVQPAETYRVGPYTLMHRRRIFVYPRHDQPGGFWINGGVHPLFAVPMDTVDNQVIWHRHPAFLYTGFALIMPPFVGYAQGWEVMQPERLPRQARAWKILGEHISPLDITALPPTPEGMRMLQRPVKGKSREAAKGEKADRPV